MTWSISFNAPNKTAAKLAATSALAASMLQQKPHARDFSMALNAIHAAIDVCEEGRITVSANGYVNGNWTGDDMPAITGVNMSLNVFSTFVLPQAPGNAAATPAA